MSIWSKIEETPFGGPRDEAPAARHVSEVMLRPLCVSPDVPAILACDIAEKNGLTHLVAVGELVPLGVVCIDDLRRADAAATVTAFIRPSVIGIGPETRLQDAADIMCQWQCEVLLVFDQHALIGIVSLTDLHAAGLRDNSVAQATCSRCGHTGACRRDLLAGDRTFCLDCVSEPYLELTLDEKADAPEAARVEAPPPWRFNARGPVLAS